MVVIGMFKIGNLRIRNPVFLAPMIDVTDLAYRQLCRKYVGMAYTEMIYISAILHENPKTKKLMMTNSNDKPIGLQVTGNNAEEFKELAKMNLKDYDLIDINCGCPSLRITGNEAGSYLLKNPGKIKEMIEILDNKIVTAKIRLGFKKNNVMKIAKEIEKAGTSALTVHARLANQGSSVKADWKWIKKVKREVGIPVIGNGDIKSGEDVDKMLDICDGAMVARAAIGNPLIFREIQRYLKTGKENKITKEEKLNEFKKYLELAKDYDVADINWIKRLGVEFLKGFKGAAKLREGFMLLKTYREIKDFVGKI
ncbi:tRNA-dihydrouridine synthase [Candidatus Pacearchaeota archaeon CG_4_10_14_0_2_um_filter_35_33]|nr:MAG: tRNA-dihydrouridine synthase [Candidatus Pacearchaeota archaeon CG_4_10_14_0_2_um_filter_35_33]PJA70147.1 MAG: tRNA-dihydrouridine synthase [Candidatus Pacearchaeota archaeon CG_4_9_14_3_um_filter_35_19]PJB93873.1 MAG: tRNA-dihydrouridine synthase [Candidatus Pacearchaeota archaeon CG_4_9_14_0_8_um_filter_35_24]